MGNSSMQTKMLFATAKFAVVVSLLLLAAAPASGQNLEVRLPSVHDDVGQIIEIPVLVDDVTGKGVTTFYLKIGFDAAVLKVNRSIITNTVSDVEGAAKFDGKNTPGEFTIAYAAPATRPLVGAGTLILVEAEVLASGSTDLSFLAFELNDGNVPANTANGSFSTSAEVDEESDNDGVPDATEADVPNLNGSGTGDGNGDGIQDNEQENVASLLDATNDSYMTVAVSEGTVLNNVSVSATPPEDDLPAPIGIEFPNGYLSFKVQGESGAATSVTVYTAHEADTYYKFGPTADNPVDHWYEFLYDGTTGAEFLDGRVILHFVDGERGDADLAANGTIDDPGALAIKVNQAPSAATILSPVAGASVTVGGSAGEEPADGDTALLTVEWSGADDPEDDEVSYTLVVSENAEFTAEIDRFEVAGATEMSVSVSRAAEWFDAAHGSAELEASATVHLRIISSDGSLETVGESASLDIVRGTITSIEDTEIPNAFALQGNYPNPFNPSTHVTFDVAGQAAVSIDVFDSLGRRVLSVPNEMFVAGMGQSIEINASALPSGSYIYRVRVEMVQSTHVSSGMMTVMK